MKPQRMILLIAFSGWLLFLWGGGLYAGSVVQATPTFFQAVNVRGRIMRQVNNHQYPAGRVRVRLKRSGSNDAGQTDFTASDGMYSFRNVTPGGVVIEVLGGNPERVMRSLSVQIPNRPTVDIPQIAL